MDRSVWNVAKRYSQVVLISLIATALFFPYSLHAQEADANPPRLDSILESLERTAEQNPALSRPYEVRREYKVFREDDPMPVSDIMAQISFTPPETKTFEITKAEGSPRGKRIVTTILKQEIDSAKDGHRGDITRSNYNFTFLREQKFGVLPEYVLHIIPRRKEKGPAPRRHLGGCQDIPHPPDRWSPAQESLDLGRRPSHHRAICRRERHVVTRFCGRHRDHPLSRDLHPFRSRFAAPSCCFKRIEPLKTAISDLDCGTIVRTNS